MLSKLQNIAYSLGVLLLRVDYEEENQRMTEI